MRDPAKVLNSLAKHSVDLQYKFKRLYRTLFNPEMFFSAYQHLYAKPGNMTKGTDGKTIDGMNLSRINSILDSLKDETYQPKASRRTYIPKKNGKMRPLGIPSFNDKLVQEVIRKILESIYEGSFELSSHGFRPQRSCQTALLQIQRTYTGSKWFIEGDIKGFFDNINHDVLINMLRNRIHDERFIRLIRKFLKAGYMEDWQFNSTYSGTPQGGLISPVLANIYLDQLDKYIAEYIKTFEKGNSRRRDPEQAKRKYDKRSLQRKLEIETNEDARADLIKNIKEIEKVQFISPQNNEMDEKYRRLKYVRYADDFLIGVIGRKKDCQQIKDNIKKFLAEKLKLELSDQKTLITHGKHRARFLSYDIYVRQSNQIKRNKLGIRRRAFGHKIVLEVPSEVIRKKLISLQAMKLVNQNGNEIWKPKARTVLRNNDDLEILQRVNAEIRGVYNYYSIANNSSKLHNYKYIMEYSMYKTFASKYQSSVRKILRKYRQNKSFTVHYTAKGMQKTCHFYNEGFKRKINNQNYNPDIPPNIFFTLGRNSLMARLKAELCELCGASDSLEMHHIRKMKDIKGGKAEWEIRMIARKRKTMAVCKNCHTKIHNGQVN